MMQAPALNRQPRRTQEAIMRSMPAPVGGWNDRDPLSAMDPSCAVILDNFFCLPSKIVLRNGSTVWATGLNGQVESMMAFNPQSGTAKLFAAAGTVIYDVTSTGVATSSRTGASNARWQHINMATSGGNFLMAVNGANKLQGYNGSAWWADGDGTHDISGVDTSTCIDICIFKRRMWLIKANTSSVYYGPVDSIAGAFSQIDLGPLFARGGTLVKMVNWSIDAGVGIDDYAAFISSQGEVALYKGSDPSSVSTWALVGVFYMGSPIGQRCAVQYGKDVLIVSKDGLVPLSIAIMTGRLLTNVALTDKIQNTVSASTTTYGSNFGWQIMPYPGENMIILNVPIAVGLQQQYVMNTISGAWSRFKGWSANCFELFNDELYFGANGSVYKAWTTRADGGTAISYEALQAFNYFGNRDNLKEFTLARPLISITNNVNLTLGLNTDFDMTQPTGSPTLISATAGQWQTGKWGSAKWSGVPVPQRAWQSVVGIGLCAGLHMMGSTSTGKLEWAATDYAFKPAGVL